MRLNADTLVWAAPTAGWPGADGPDTMRANPPPILCDYIPHMKPTSPALKTTSDRLTTVLSYGALLLLIYLVYRITEPFLVPLAWSAVLEIFFYPMYQRIEKRMNPTRAALGSTVGGTLGLLL